MRRQIIIADFRLGEEMVMAGVATRQLHFKTGKQGTMMGMVIARIVDGKMVEGWGVRDRLGMDRQLGQFRSGR